MATDVSMPKLADTLVEGTLARWLKTAHEAVQAGEPIAEIETDKVTTELTAPASGTLGDLLVAEGQTVPIGTPLVRIFASVGAGVDADAGLGGLSPPVSSPNAEAELGDLSLTPSTNDAASETKSDASAQTETQPKRTSPLAARVAQEHGIDLSQVQATGARITRADVERHLAQSREPVAQPPSQPEPQPITATTAISAPARPTHSLSPRDELLPLTGLRRATAQRMALVHQIPTGSAVVEADVTALVDGYKKEREGWLGREGFPLTYTPYFIQAMGQSLRAWPAARATFSHGHIVPREGVHIGVAVALKDGLIVPVLRDVDQQDFVAIARAQADLVNRARAHRLRPEEVTGGVATLTNVGSMGGLLALPMLNENQAVILGVGAITLRAIGTNSGILYRSCLYLSLTFDRRLLDDLQAERFLLDVAGRLEGQLVP